MGVLVGSSSQTDAINLHRPLDSNMLGLTISNLANAMASIIFFNSIIKILLQASSVSYKCSVLICDFLASFRIWLTVTVS